MNRPLSALALAVLAPPLLVACGDGEGDAGGQAAASSDGWSVVGALEQVPASIDAEPLLLSTGDLAQALEIAGLERGTDGSRETTASWLLPLTGVAQGETAAEVFVPLGDLLAPVQAAPEEFAEVAGWSVVDVDSFVEVGSPPRRFTAVTGDDLALAGTLVEVDDEIRTDVDGEDFRANLAAVGPTSRTGVPNRYASKGDAIAVSTATPVVRDWLDDAERLADDDALSSLARSLDAEGVYAAVISEAGAGGLERLLDGQGTSEQLDRLRAQYEPRLPEGVFDYVGIGWDHEDDAPLLHVAYHFVDAAEAAEGAEALEKAWTEGTTIQGTGIADLVEVAGVDESDGVVRLSLTLRGDARVDLPYRMLINYDPVFVSR